MSDHMTEAAKVLEGALTDPDSLNHPAGLIGQLMSANFRDYSNTTSWLIESLERTVADRDAELAAIRVRINQLFAGDYMPNQDAIIQAVFYPAKSLVDSCRTQEVDR